MKKGEQERKEAASYSRATSKLIDRPEESRPGDKEWELSFRNSPSKASHRSAKRKQSPKEGNSIIEREEEAEQKKPKSPDRELQDRYDEGDPEVDTLGETFGKHEFLVTYSLVNNNLNTSSNLSLLYLQLHLAL